MRFFAPSCCSILCTLPWCFAKLCQNKAVEFSKLQICVDLFLFSAGYTDVASLVNLPKFTAGQLFYYPVSRVDCVKQPRSCVKSWNHGHFSVCSSGGTHAGCRIAARDSCVCVLHLLDIIDFGFWASARCRVTLGLMFW